MRPRTVLALLVALAAGGAGAQGAPTVVWEPLPLVGDRPGTNGPAVAFFPGDPTPVWISGYGPLLYNPDGDPDDSYGDWDNLCTRGCAPYTGVITPRGTVLIGAPAGATLLSRLPLGGVWEYKVAGEGYHAFPIYQSSLPALRNADGEGALFYHDGGSVGRSDDDGREGTWRTLGETGGDGLSFGEVPPSPALPDGRLLVGMYNGVAYSDDGGETWSPGEGAYGFAQFIAYSFAFVPEPGHPFGGVALAGLYDFAFGRDSTATVYASDDGGATWERRHRFSPSALGLDNANEVALLATRDGAVWAGVGPTRAGSTPAVGAIVRSEDGGRTWTDVGEGYGGWRVRSLTVGPEGRVYAATDVGVWRTTEPVYPVAGEPAPVPPEAGGLGLSVRPNPTCGAAVVVLELASPERVRVSVVDAGGREVAVAWDGPAADGQRVGLDTAGWAAGAYRVRVTAASGAGTSAGLTVLR